MDIPVFQLYLRFIWKMFLETKGKRYYPIRITRETLSNNTDREWTPRIYAHYLKNRFNDNWHLYRFKIRVDVVRFLDASVTDHPIVVRLNFIASSLLNLFTPPRTYLFSRITVSSQSLILVIFSQSYAVLVCIKRVKFLSNVHNSFLYPLNVP